MIKEEDKAKINQEFVQLMEFLKSKVIYYRETSVNLLHMWDRIEKEEKLFYLSKFARFAQSLPTSSATIEQSFSLIKLLKTDLLNSLSESSLEGLILEWGSSKKVIVCLIFV